MKIISCFMEPLLDIAKENQRQYFELLDLLSEENEVFFMFLEKEQEEYFEHIKNRNNKFNIVKWNDNKKYDILFIFGGTFNDKEKIKNSVLGNDNFDKYFYLNKFIERNSNVKIYNYLYDPKCTKLTDVDIINKSLNGREILYLNAYYDKIKNHKALSIFEYFCFKDYNVNFNIKKYDFVFGYTASMETNRKYLSDFISNNVNENDKVLIFAKDKFIKRNNLINQKEYFDKIKMSKFSLVAPSNDKDSFSFSRMLECISNRCIPLILEGCNIEIIKDNYIDLYEYIKNNLIIKLNESVNNKINLINYDKTINEILNLKSVKEFDNQDFDLASSIDDIENAPDNLDELASEPPILFFLAINHSALLLNTFIDTAINPHRPNR